MKKTLWILCLVIVGIEVFLIQNIGATLIKSRDFIIDSDTGLEWLIMSRSMNTSPAEIINSNSKLSKEGWIFASQIQIENFFKNAGWTGPLEGGWTPGNLMAAKLIVGLMGFTYTTRNVVGIQALAASGQSLNSFPCIFISYNEVDGVGGAGFFGSFPPEFKSTTFGNWLVRRRTFGNNSATLTNMYVPMKIGDKLTYKTYGLDNIIFLYLEAISQETIDHVNCLKIKNSNSYFPNLISYYWLAQDNSGNVWILKYYDEGTNDLIFFGIDNAKLVMPSKVYVETTLWNIDATETVVATGVTVPKLSTGLGPYTNCIRSRINYGDGDIDLQYYAPGIGQVKVKANDEGINGYEIFLIERAIVEKSKSMPWLPLLLD